MKTLFRTLIPAAMTVIAAMSAVTSCKKPGDDYNPKVENFAQAPFTLKAEEGRSGGEYVLPWVIDSKGVADNLIEEIDVPTLTAYNTFVLEVVPDKAAGFPGVNVRSDNACVKVDKIDATHFALKRVEDGSANVSVWNGSGNGEFRITFKVEAKGSIPIEGLLVLIDGKEEVLVEAVDYDMLYADMPVFYSVKWVSNERIEPWLGMTVEDELSFYEVDELDPHKVEVLHTVPENTTWRRFYDSMITLGTFNRVFFANECDWFQEKYDRDGGYSFPDGADVSVIYGKTCYIGSCPSAKKGSGAFGMSGRYNVCQKKASAGTLPAIQIKHLSNKVNQY